MNSSFSIPNVYSDHMVFQRGMPITIVGTAPAHTDVVVSFDGVAKTVAADRNGDWRAEFPALPAGTGHSIKAVAVSGATIEFKDIAIGDVWIAGGQSNMEFPVAGVQFYSLIDGDKTAAAANDPDLRILRVQRAISPDGPCREFPRGTEWKPATSPDAVGPCSAVGYLFGQLLRKRLGIPVGIVSTNWGGCRIEPWIDEETLRRHRCATELGQIAEARELGKLDKAAFIRATKPKGMEKDDALGKWLKGFFASNPAETKTALASWAKPGCPLKGWTIKPLAEMEGSLKPGVIWYRREVEVPKGWDPKKLRFGASWMNDTDETFWDGHKIGQTGIDTPSYWAAPRDYTVPAALAKPGRHTLAIRLANHFQTGGLGQMWICEEGSGKRILVDGGPWAERVELRPPARLGVRPAVPNGLMRNSYTLTATLFNAMFAPLSTICVKGAIWYQGCSNTGEAMKYRLWQKLLVESWRRATRSPKMAFIQVQLAGFQRHSPQSRLSDDFWRKLEPEDNGWCQMRQVQAEIGAMPLCDLVTATDIGDHSDIHPANKGEVARRLDAVAGKMLYGAKGTATGPILKSVKRKGAALVCSFSETGSGLVVREKPICGAPDLKPPKDAFIPEEHAFAVASARGKWVWASARRVGNTVVVSSPDVPDPARVRYAWANFPPSMRLFNKNGFPAFPFEGTV